MISFMPLGPVIFREQVVEAEDDMGSVPGP